MQKPKSSEIDDIQFWERMNFLIGDERPYPWSERMGLNRSAFQSARTRGKKPLPKTVRNWADKIGCSYEWLQNGVGQPFDKLASHTSQPGTKYEIEFTRESLPNPQDFNERVSQAFKTAVDTHQPKQNLRSLLMASYEGTEGALAATYTIMEPAVKAEFLVQFMRALTKALDLYDEQTLMLAIFSIELPLYQTRQSMSLNDKVQLISAIYNLYDSNAEMKKATLAEYLKYKEDINNGRGRAQ